MKNSAYTPLDGSRSIRLLNLKPSEIFAADIICTMHPVSLDDQPIYEALSWKWGIATATETIRLNGMQHSARKVLAEALRQYRLVNEPRLLWVDAICINQPDLLERASQICLMRDIYRQAVTVQVWLGPMRSERYTDVFSVFEAMANGISIRQLYHQHVMGGNGPLISEEEFDKYYAPDSTLGRWNATVDEIDHDFLENLRRFYDLGWWNRLWVLQEVVVAETVLLRWGIKKIALETLLKAQDFMNRDLAKQYHSTARVFGSPILEDFLDSVAKYLEPIHYLRSLQSATEHADAKSREQEIYGLLIETLALCRTRDTSDPRDKIYGLLGMLPADVSAQIQPSYLDSEKTVFHNLACLILQKTKSFMLFNCLLDDQDAWIPDWTRPYHQFNDFHGRVLQQQLFSAGHGAEWDLSVTADGSLHQKGIRIDILAYVKQFFYDPTDSKLVRDMIDEWTECLWNNESQSLDSDTNTRKQQVQEYLRLNNYPNGSTISYSTWRMLLNDCVPLTESGNLVRAQGRDLQNVQQWFDAISTYGGKEAATSPDTGAADGLSLQNDEDQAAICEFIGNNMKGKDFFYTKIGYTGLVPDQFSKIGDEIWVLAGASHPVVLRAIDAKKLTFKAVSEAYVQGIMDGEISRGRCPILPSDESADLIREQFAKGRTSWQVPEWKNIRIV